MDDCVSRQAAIDAVHKNYDGILDFRSDGETVAQSFEDILTALPSAQPERKKELPSARPDCTDCIKNGGDWNCDHIHCHKGKSAQPEIILCKDCKYYQEDHLFRIGFCDGRQRNNDDFCSRAERRTDG